MSNTGTLEGVLPLNASQTEEIVTLRVQLENYQNKIQTLSEEIRRMQSESMSQNDESATIAHIRGNLT
jgi:TolA-binding protein